MEILTNNNNMTALERNEITKSKVDLVVKDLERLLLNPISKKLDLAGNLTPEKIYENEQNIARHEVLIAARSMLLGMQKEVHSLLWFFECQRDVIDVIINDINRKDVRALSVNSKILRDGMNEIIDLLNNKTND
jgi:hypothetical protein